MIIFQKMLFLYAMLLVPIFSFSFFWNLMDEKEKKKFKEFWRNIKEGI
ncbi:hypothetical protein [Bacillus pacificus]|nr:hypothetical protein [Bacillus pacificus]MCU5732807.1 hypothetical protein [Bacillus pacificus]